MYKKVLKQFSDENPERFNKEFIYSKNDDNVLTEMTNIFKSLEIIDNIKIESVTYNAHEEEFGPIKQQGHYYKSLLESRLAKITYRVKIEGREGVIEKDMFLPKMLHNTFYVNEGVRFYPIWQVVDNLSYATNNGVSLKSLMMPITMIQNDPITVTPEFGETAIDKVPNYHALIFNKKLSPLYYIMLPFALKSLDDYGVSPFEDLSKYQTYQDSTLIDKFNKFFNVDIKFDNDPSQLIEDGRVVFQLSDKKTTGLSFSISKDKLQDEKILVILGMLLSTREKEKKNKLVFTKEQFITPWFWLDSLINASGFSKSNDPYKRLEKIQGVFISLQRIIDDQTRISLPIKSEDKENIFTIMRYLLINFKELFAADPQNLHTKRVRLYEYILYPLRVYFAQHINRIINQRTNNDVKSIEKIFTSLTPMFLIKNLITSQLLRTYNATNDFNLFSAYLKGTFKGPQALGKGVSFEQRDLNPSYVGRIDLVAASPGDPGVSFTFSPFLKVYNGYFDKDEYNKTL